MQRFLLKISVIIFCLLCCFEIYAQQKKDSSDFKNEIKLDLFPLYFDFFDYRDQARVGIDLERGLNKKSSISLYIDVGKFDDFTYRKYYDFFSQNFHYIEQVIYIKGIHIQPSYTFYFFNSKMNTLKAFAGGIMDLQFYKKRQETYNSQTMEDEKYNYGQFKAGLGAHAGMKYFFAKRFFAEARTSIYFKLYDHISSPLMNPVKVLNAQWNDKKYNFWWVSNLMIGYAF